MDPETLLVIALVFVLLLLLAAWALMRLISPPTRAGTVVAVDQPRLGGMEILVSERYRLRGKPDELRRARDGSVVPVEIKSSRAPRNGVPYPSHRIQLLTYCLLVEEGYRTPPPYGILAYGDGSEIRVAWNSTTRQEMLSVLEEWNSPYMGALDPSPGKCRSCQFSAVCPGAASLRASG